MGFFVGFFLCGFIFLGGGGEVCHYFRVSFGNL